MFFVGARRLLSLAFPVTLGITALHCGANSPNGDAPVTVDASTTVPGEEDAGSPGQGFGDSGGNVGPGEDASCGRLTNTTERVPIVLEFVLDRSASMADVWAAEQEAFARLLDRFIAANEQKVALGLILFPKVPIGGAQVFPAEGDVAPGPLTNELKEKIAAHFAEGTIRNGPTPLSSAMKGGYGELQSFAPAPGSPLDSKNLKRALVAFSDGQLNAEATPSKAIAAEMKKKGILTFAVAIASGKIYISQMGAIAVAGGTAPPNCDSTDPSKPPCPFVISPGTPSNQMATAFFNILDTIRAQATCEFILTADAAADPANVNIRVTDANGKVHELVQDPVEGWTYDDPSHPGRVILHGSACSMVTASPYTKVEITIGCKTRIQ